jgi:transposase-like protein
MLKKHLGNQKRAGKKKPKLIMTDGLQSYKGAFKSEFHDYEFSTRYAINSGFGPNSFIERMQENIREREKWMIRPLWKEVGFIITSLGRIWDSTV